MQFAHQPVLLKECIRALNLRPYGYYVDCTLGGAGHSLGILATEPTINLIGIDQDPAAIARASHRLVNFGKQVTLVQENFRHLKKILADLKISKVNGILLDIGVSSFQLDKAERGFSYQHKARLDMRMDPRNPLDAWTVVNTYNQEELARILLEYGEEKWAARISKFIVHQRAGASIDTTEDLVTVIKKAVPIGARTGGPHPARRTFQAIRIAVNDELGALREVLEQAVQVLDSQGRLLVISFHSLEDRLVKKYFQELEGKCICPPGLPVCSCGQEAVARTLTSKPIVASAEERERNPRSRSAKLRVAEKL